MRGELDAQADAIEAVLACHRLSAWVVGGQITPRFVRFELVTGPGVRVRQVVRLAEELALHLGVSACRVYRHRSYLRVEVPRAGGQVVRCLPLCERLARRNLPPCSALLGLDAEGSPLLLHLPSPDVAHVLIAGTTGSGKTVLAQTMLASLACLNRPSAVLMVLVDPKGRGWGGLGGLPHLLEPVVTRAEEALPLLHRLVALMEQRDREGRSEPRVVIALDELADLMLVGGPPTETALTRLSQRGREAGLHLIACTQKPTAAVIGSLVKSNFPVRLVGAVTSPEDAKVATGMAGSGAERLLGRGDFVLVARGQVTRFQAACISAQEIGQLLARLRRGGEPARTGTWG